MNVRGTLSVATLTDFDSSRAGIISMVLCFGLGIGNIFLFHWVILFAVICL